MYNEKRSWQARAQYKHPFDPTLHHTKKIASPGVTMFGDASFVVYLHKLAFVAIRLFPAVTADTNAINI